MAIDRRREAAGGGSGRQPPPAEENGSLPPGDAAASVPLGGSAGPGGSAEIQPLPPLHPGGGGPHSSCCSAAAAPSLLLLDYDGSVLPFLGGLGGGYQKTLVLLTWIPALFIGFSQFSDSFLLDQPNFWCRGAGKGAEVAGATVTGRWGDVGNWTSPPTTPFTAAWGAAGNRSNSSGPDGGDTPPLPSPPDKGDNASNCDCHEWDYGIRTGLVQNVVSKVRAATALSPHPREPFPHLGRFHLLVLAEDQDCCRASRGGDLNYPPQVVLVCVYMRLASI
jgi:OCT family organic anion transporter-like MFS transporter 23